MNKLLRKPTSYLKKKITPNEIKKMNKLFDNKIKTHTRNLLLTVPEFINVCKREGISKEKAMIWIGISLRDGKIYHIPESIVKFEKKWLNKAVRK